jgi:DNA-binding NarL/FixJ family response regulator
MRVLIVDDSACFRQAARALLERRGYDVVGEVACAGAAIEAVASLTPDAVLLDVVLPDGTGFGVSAAITATQPAPAVLLVSSEDFGTCFGLAEECGARGFVLKSQLGQCELSNFWPLPEQEPAA